LRRITKKNKKQIALWLDCDEHYWICLLCREPETLGKGPKALGKDFAEGQKHPRQSPRRRRETSKLTLSLPRAGKAGSRQRLFIFLKKNLCREPSKRNGYILLFHAPPVQIYFFEKNAKKIN